MLSLKKNPKHSNPESCHYLHWKYHFLCNLKGSRNTNFKSFPNTTLNSFKKPQCSLPQNPTPLSSTSSDVFWNQVPRIQISINKQITKTSVCSKWWLIQVQFCVCVSLTHFPSWHPPLSFHYYLLSLTIMLSWIFWKDYNELHAFAAMMITFAWLTPNHISSRLDSRINSVILAVLWVSELYVQKYRATAVVYKPRHTKEEDL